MPNSNPGCSGFCALHSQLIQTRAGKRKRSKQEKGCKCHACHTWAQPVLATEINQPKGGGRGLHSQNQSQSEAPH